jgi:hypothetical protein
VAAVARIDTPLDDTYVRCRSYGHAWDEFAPIDLHAPLYGWRLSLRCLRCQTERHDNLDFKGRVMSRRYLYADGYQQKGVPKVIFREALFSKLRAKLEKANQIGGEIPEPEKKGRKRVSVGV